MNSSKTKNPSKYISVATSLLEWEDESVDPNSKVTSKQIAQELEDLTRKFNNFQMNQHSTKPSNVETNDDQSLTINSNIQPMIQTNKKDDDASERSQLSSISAEIDERLQQLKNRLAELEKNDLLNDKNNHHDQGYSYDYNLISHQSHDHKSDQRLTSQGIRHPTKKLNVDVNQLPTPQYRLINSQKISEQLGMTTHTYNQYNQSTQSSTGINTKKEGSLYQEYLKQTNKLTTYDKEFFNQDGYNNYNNRNNTSHNYDVEQTIAKVLKKSEQLFKLHKCNMDDAAKFDNDHHRENRGNGIGLTEFGYHNNESDMGMNDINTTNNNINSNTNKNQIFQRRNTLEDEIDATWNRAQLQFEKWHSLNHQFKKRDKLFDNKKLKNELQNDVDSNDYIDHNYSTIEPLSPKEIKDELKHLNVERDDASPEEQRKQLPQVTPILQMESVSSGEFVNVLPNKQTPERDMKMSHENRSRSESINTMEHLSQKLRMYENKLREIDPTLLE